MPRRLRHWWRRHDVLCVSLVAYGLVAVLVVWACGRLAMQPAPVAPVKDERAYRLGSLYDITLCP